jgi:hypothetical protein
VLAHDGKTLGSRYINQQNPSNTGPFGITYMQVKSHPRNLLGLQEPGFCNNEGMGGDPLIHSYLSTLRELYCVFYSLVT